MSMVIRSYIDKDEASAALRRSISAVVDAVRGVRDPNVVAVGTWTARDVAVHLGDLLEAQGGIVRGKPGPIGRVDLIAEVNQGFVEANPERDMDRLADRIASNGDLYIEGVEGAEGGDVVRWAEHEIPVTALASMGIGECLVHGFDLTNAENRPIEIDGHDAALAGKGVSPVTRHFVDAEATKDIHAAVRLRLRGEWEMDFVFDHGVLDIREDKERRADAHISADPVAFLLVGYGRIPVWKPAIKGQMLAWGRKPWLALRFPSYLKNP